jgi:chromosome partitioning protein
MSVVLIGGEKGGTGKSTIATNLAAYLANEGVDVILLDADPQATSSHWIERRNSNEDGLKPIQCAQRFGDIASTVRDLSKRYKVIVIDAGGRDSRELRSAMLVADKIVVPVRASQADLETLGKVNELVGNARAFNETLTGAYVTLSIAPTNPAINEVQEARELLELHRFPELTLSDQVIRERKVYRDALAEGRGAVEMSNNQAKAEIQLLAQDLFNFSEETK